MPERNATGTRRLPWMTVAIACLAIACGDDGNRPGMSPADDVGDASETPDADAESPQDADAGTETGLDAPLDVPDETAPDVPPDVPGDPDRKSVV